MTSLLSFRKTEPASTTTIFTFYWIAVTKLEPRGAGDDFRVVHEKIVLWLVALGNALGAEFVRPVRSQLRFHAHVRFISVVRFGLESERKIRLLVS